MNVVGGWQIWPLLVLVIGCSESESWKPTGDGRTIVNTRTGELTDTKTGLPVKELNEKRRRDEETARLEALRNAPLLEAQRKAAETELKLAAKKRQEVENESQRILWGYPRNNSHNQVVYLEIKEFVQSRNEENFPISKSGAYLAAEWDRTVAPFRRGQWPTRQQRDNLLELLERFKRDAAAPNRGNHKLGVGPEWQTLYENLSGMQY